MPVTGELQCPDSIDVVSASRHAQAAIRIVNRVRQADVDSAKCVNDLDEAEEVHLDEVVDGQAGRPLYRPHHKPRPAEAERRVNLVHPVAGYSHPGISRQADDR
jgi:hypothetical protein